jgi:predicted nucleic acid-binding protein
VKTAYCDSNFWLRLFVEFPESESARLHVENLKAGDEVRFALTWLQRVEVTNAFSLLTFQARSGRFPRVTPEQSAAALENFRELADGRSFAVNQALDVVDLEPRCIALSERYTIKHGFRTYDLMHVSAALILDCDSFLSFDRKATALAELEGLKVLKLAGH